MSEVTTTRFVEDAAIAFVMYCDSRALKASERERLAEDIFDECCASVGDTVGIFPELEDRA